MSSKCPSGHHSRRRKVNRLVKGNVPPQITVRQTTHCMWAAWWAVSYWHTTKHGLAPFNNCHHPLALDSHLHSWESATWHCQKMAHFSQNLWHTMGVRSRTLDETWRLKRNKQDSVNFLRNIVQGLHEAPCFEHFTTIVYTASKHNEPWERGGAFKDTILLYVTALCGLNKKKSSIICSTRSGTKSSYQHQTY